jgi:ABC-2 type transport system ATP-binding protein
MDRIIIEHQGKILMNEPIDHIAEKLSFRLTPDQIGNGDLLFRADGFNQNETVSVNHSNQQGQVDIELLFNAAIAQPKEISRIFTPQNLQS